MQNSILIHILSSPVNPQRLVSLGNLNRPHKLTLHESRGFFSWLFYVYKPSLPSKVSRTYACNSTSSQFRENHSI